MMEPRNSKHQAGSQQEKQFRGAGSGKAVAGAVAAGRSAYRDEYECDHGPDLDEPLDGNESGIEF